MRAIFLFIFLLSVSCLNAQVNADKFRINASKIVDAPVIDGLLDEQVWRDAEKTTEFIQNFPSDTDPATSQTRIMVSFDEENIYFAGICFDNSGKKDVIQSLKRDFSFRNNENVSIYFDPFNDYSNGFTFGISAAGIQREGLVTGGANVSTDWDNKWLSAIQKYDDRWEFEMAIPFKTIRYNESNREWNLLVLRQDLKNNERSTWPPVPIGFRPSDLAFSGKLAFEEPLKKSGVNVSLIPYITGGVSKNHEDGTDLDYTRNVGFDAKIAITSSLNLDLTVNPDFSQVEVDQQVTNLSRFEIFFPERRQFFLENQDLFSGAGFPSSRPFFSRRIGIARDTSDDVKQIPILYGARLSGKIGNKIRIGVLNMQTKADEAAQLTGVEEISDFVHKLPSQNYSVFTVQRQMFARSNLTATLVNRQVFNYDESDTTLTTTKFNRVLGLDYELLSADGKWNGTYYYHRSFDPDEKGHNYSFGSFMGYNTRKLRVRTFVSGSSENYNAEMGFIQRTDVINFGGFSDYIVYPKGPGINRHTFGFRAFLTSDFKLSKTDEQLGLSYEIDFANTSELSFEVSRIFQKLRDGFDPSRSDGLELEEDNSFQWTSYEMGYETDSRKIVSGAVGIDYGGYYNGKRTNVGIEGSYRYQPYANFSILVDYNDIRLPAPYSDATFWLVGPKIELTFTDKLFLTTFVQFNSQDDNIGHNTRFQWRFKPASDLFIVYTDNYLPDGLQTKNRALILKLSYWLNV